MAGPSVLGKAELSSPTRALDRGIATVQGSGRPWRSRFVKGTLVQSALMEAPAVVLFGGLIVIPLFMAIYFSFTGWNGLSASKPFVGLHNYREAFEDPSFVRAYVVTGIISVACVLITNVLGFGVAVLIKAPGAMSSLYRTIMFYPYVLSGVAIGFLFGAILGYQGAVNAVLGVLLHIQAIQFIGTPNLAVVSLVITISWQLAGFCTVVYLAGLQTIPQEVLDSAAVDGCGRWSGLRRITIPMMSATIAFNVVIMLVFMLRTYDIVVSLTDGGPAGSTETVAFKIINDAFANNQLGYGSAQSVMLIIVTALVVVVAGLARRRSSRSWQ